MGVVMEESKYCICAILREDRDSGDVIGLDKILTHIKPGLVSQIKVGFNSSSDRQVASAVAFLEAVEVNPDFDDVRLVTYISEQPGCEVLLRDEMLRCSRYPIQGDILLWVEDLRGSSEGFSLGRISDKFSREPRLVLLGSRLQVLSSLDEGEYIRSRHPVEGDLDLGGWWAASGRAVRLKKFPFDGGPINDRNSVFNVVPHKGSWNKLQKTTYTKGDLQVRCWR